jgi:hypothetical protein
MTVFSTARLSLRFNLRALKDTSAAEETGSGTSQLGYCRQVPQPGSAVVPHCDLALFFGPFVMDGRCTREATRRDAGGDPARVRLRRSRRASSDRAVRSLVPSGTEVLVRLRTAPLAPSVPKPRAGRERTPKRAASARDEARDRLHKDRAGVKSQAQKVILNPPSTPSTCPVM